MLKVAIIGCGGIGLFHAHHIKDNDNTVFADVEVVGLCDLIESRAKALADFLGSGRVYTDFIEMYDKEQPDAVFICIPPTCHGFIEFETIRRGIPFYVEKPLTLDMDLAKEILRRVEEKNLITAAGFQCRYDNINDAAKEYIKDHRIIHTSCQRVGGIPSMQWWRVKAQSGGQLVEQAIHQMDIFRYLIGEPETVYSVATRGVIPADQCPNYYSDDASTTLITFKDGTTATMMTGCYSTNGASWDSKMTLGSYDSRMDYYLCLKVRFFGLKEEDVAAEAAGTISGDGTQRPNPNETGIVVNNSNDSGVVSDRTFLDAVISGDDSKIRSPYRDAIKTLAFVLACNKSMETGLPVKVDEM